MARNPAQLGSHKQLFVSYLPINAPNFPEFRGSSQIISANPAKCFQSRGEREASVVWWQVAIHAEEVWRQTENVAEAAVVGPLSQQVINNLVKDPERAGPARPGPQLTGIPIYAARYSALKARVTFTDQTATQRIVECDIGGGTTLSFCGSHVGVDVLFPEPTIELPPSPDAEELAKHVGVLPPGIVLDSFVQASAAPAPCAPIGRRAARFSLTRRVIGGTPFLFEIPAGAVEVATYATNDQSLNTWRWMTGPTTTSPIPVGALPQSPLVVAPIPGGARWLEVTTPTPETVTVVYTLEY